MSPRAKSRLFLLGAVLLAVLMLVGSYLTRPR